MRKAFDLRLVCQSKQGRMPCKLDLSVSCTHFLGVPGGRVDWFGRAEQKLAKDKKEASEVGTKLCGDALWIEVAGRSGPAWAERALFSLFPSFPQRRRSSLDSLYDHQLSRIEGSRPASALRRTRLHSSRTLRFS